MSDKRSYRLHLHKRKTNQGGGVRPFILKPRPSTPWLCPFAALMNYLMVLKRAGMADDYAGPLFMPSKKSGVLKWGERLSYPAFKTMFNVDMTNIKGESAKHYSSHLFRRGGCQYYCVVLKWTIKKVCEWGDGPRILMAIRWGGI